LRGSRQGEISAILFDESAVDEGISLESAAGELTEAAPVVAVAAAGRQPELRFLIASGAVDFVARDGDFVRLTAMAIKRRVQLSDYAAAGAFPAEELSGDFGEILRHEVNNPLTGILGNAELLLARRERLPQAAIERVETIAELAVRLRETVRRLSHAWEGR
jgi:signal transduction histidine kinase